jgi:hypothetical protein
MTDPRAAHDDDPFEAIPSDLAALEADGDVDALLGIAKEARKGDLPLARAAYEAAGRLGSGDALYALALIRFQAGDEGTAKVSLREAADSGHLLARIHLANLYETGAVYTQDAEKATNWYRMAARSAGIDMDSEDGRRRLAELGGIRATRALDEAGALGDEEREKLLRKARLHGARAAAITAPAAIRPAAETASDEAPASPSLRGAASSSDSAAEPSIRATRQVSAPAKAAPAKAPASKAEPARKKAVTPRPKGHGSAVDGLFATLWTTLFAAGGLGAGFAVRAGVAELYAKGEAIPVYGTHAEYIFPSVALTVTFLPSFLFFRGATVLKSLPIGAIGYAAGVHLASGQMRVIPADLLPTVLGAAAFLGAALGFGLFGGAKPRPVAPVEL